MTYDGRVRPHMVRPSDADGAIVDDGTYGLAVVKGTTDGLVPVARGLTSADGSVTISDNGDGTLDLSAPGGGGSSDDFGAAFAPPFASGRWYEAQGFTALGTTTATAGSIQWLPIFVPNSVTISDAACEVTSGASGSTLRFGIYADDHGAPGNLIADLGSVAGTSSGVKTLTGLSQALTRGFYWLAILALGGSPTMRSVKSPFWWSPWGAAAAGETATTVGYSLSGPVAAFPSPAGGSISSSLDRRRMQIKIA